MTLTWWRRDSDLLRSPGNFGSLREMADLCLRAAGLPWWCGDPDLLRSPGNFGSLRKMTDLCLRAASLPWWYGDSDLLRSPGNFGSLRKMTDRGLRAAGLPWWGDSDLLRSPGNFGSLRKMTDLCLRAAGLPWWRTHSCVPRRDSSRRQAGYAKTAGRRQEWRRGTQKCVRHQNWLIQIPRPQEVRDSSRRSELMQITGVAKSSDAVRRSACATKAGSLKFPDLTRSETLLDASRKGRT